MKNAPLLLTPDAMVVQPSVRPLGRTPHIKIHAFCETDTFAAAMHKVARDRRFQRAVTDVTQGGIGAAIGFCSTNPTPDVLVLESNAAKHDLLASLADLAPVCDERTKVIIIGASNDISLYRELMDGGVAEYLLAPVDPLAIIGTVLRLFPEKNAVRIGKICAVVGAKGGVGSSVLAQNLAWMMAQNESATILADMDLQFGTAALNYNIDCPIGFADQLPEADRLDGALLERLLFKYGSHLSILPCATAAHIATDLDADILDKIIEIARTMFPHVLLDLPNAWSPLVRSVLETADDIIVIAEPDLASLRNARCLLDFVKAARPNDLQPRLVLNKVGMPKRKEIAPDKFVAALKAELSAQVAFDPATFSAAASNGQMIAEVSKRAAATQVLEHLARQVMGLPSPRKGTAVGNIWRRASGKA
ncbi:MAG: AAA family ATPase [Loktanella sp.]|nr:AAA family ATPase [Loktanella sp.]